MAVLEYFPPELIMLMDEMIHHEDLMYELSKVPVSEGWEARLAAVATHCGFLIDGYFTDDELAHICKQLTAKLYEKRTSIIVSH